MDLCSANIQHQGRQDGVHLCECYGDGHPDGMPDEGCSVPARITRCHGGEVWIFVLSGKGKIKVKSGYDGEYGVPIL